MTQLSSLRTRLSIELGDSETINKTDGQRDQAINDACQQIYQYRHWREIYENSSIQGVDGVFALPSNINKTAAVWYGKDNRYSWDYNFISQTDFLADIARTCTITEENGVQVLKISDTNNRGHDVQNKVGEDTIGINDVASRERVGQTFVADSETLEGILLKFSTEGTPEGTLTVNITATGGGVPTSTILATGTVNISNIGEEEQYIWTQFDKNPDIVESGTYGIEVIPSYATDANNYVKWTYSTTSQIDGSQVTYDGVGWNIEAGDNVFILCTDYWQFQYVRRFVDMENSSDDNGLPSKFDQAIAKMAAGIVLDYKSQSDKAYIKFYGNGGSENAPLQNSAFGLLNLIWTDTRMNSTRPRRRLKSIYEKRAQYSSGDIYYYHAY